jgi:hypothetical protein
VSRGRAGDVQPDRGRGDAGRRGGRGNDRAAAPRSGAHHAHEPREAWSAAPPSRSATVAVAAFAALLVLAPPATNYLWAANGLRSIPLPGAVALFVVAIAGRALVRARPRFGWWWAIAPALVLILAFPLRERVHFLGDSQTRLRAIASFTGGLAPTWLSDWAARIHAAPLDAAVNVLGVVVLRGLGLEPRDAVSVLAALLALGFAIGMGRVAERLDPPKELRLALTIALSLTGMLEAFAGYAESAGLVAAIAVWWWAQMLAPLRRPRDAVKLVGLWLALALAHRLGVVMLLPTLVRTLGPGLPGDRPEVRRWIPLALTPAVGLAVVLLLSAGGDAQLGRDVTETLYTVRARALSSAALFGVANTLLLVAPLAWLAPWFAGRDAFAAWVRHPAFPVLVVAAAPLAIGPLWLFPMAPSGLGHHRDWDLSLLLGITLTVAAGLLLARAPAPRLRISLAWCVPLVTLAAGGWLVVNADPPASLARAVAMVSRPPDLPAEPRSHGWLYLGQRAMDVGEPRVAGEAYDRAFHFNPNPRRALLAAEAWAVAGDAAAARRSLAAARRVPLTPELEASARAIEAAIGATGAAPGDSSATPRGTR